MVPIIFKCARHVALTRGRFPLLAAARNSRQPFLPGVLSVCIIKIPRFTIAGSFLEAVINSRYAPRYGAIKIINVNIWVKRVPGLMEYARDT